MYGQPYGYPYPPYPPQNSGTVYVPIQMERGGRVPKAKGIAKQLKEMFEVQELMRSGGKKDEKKDDKPKVAMIPIPTALFLGVLLSPAVGPVMYMLYKSLWAMALK
jgi:hypothetical protein